MGKNRIKGETVGREVEEIIKIVHSPPRKEKGRRGDDTNGSDCEERMEDLVGKNESEVNKGNEAAEDENGGNKEKETREQNGNVSAEDEEGEKSNNEEEKGDEEESESYEMEKDGAKKRRKKSPSAGEIEKILIKERIKVLECEVVRMREKEVRKRMEALKKEIMKIKKENEEEKKVWRREKKELEEKIRRCEREIENRMTKTAGGQRREEADEIIGAEQREKKEKGGEGENREKVRQTKSYRNVLKGKSGEKETGRNETKREGNIIMQRKKRKEGEREEGEENIGAIQMRGGRGRREEEREIEEERGRPQGASEDFLKYELKERRGRRRGLIITRDTAKERSGSKMNIIKHVCENLKIDEGKIKIKYEGENKANIEFTQMEDKIETLRNKRKLTGSGI